MSVLLLGDKKVYKKFVLILSLFQACSVPSLISPSIEVQRPKSKSFVTLQPSNPFDVQRVLNSSWLINQKEVIKKKLLTAQKLKRKRLYDEKAAAIKLERTVCYLKS